MIIDKKEIPSTIDYNNYVDDDVEKWQTFSYSLLSALGWKVYNRESALSFLMDFYRLYNERTERDGRIKTRTWDDIYSTFFTILDIDSDIDNKLDADKKSNIKKMTNKNGDKKMKQKRWKLTTVVAACEKIKWTSLQDFYYALDSVTYADEKKNKKNPVYRFLKAIELKYIRPGNTIGKAA